MTDMGPSKDGTLAIRGRKVPSRNVYGVCLAIQLLILLILTKYSPLVRKDLLSPTMHHKNVRVVNWYSPTREADKFKLDAL